MGWNMVDGDFKNSSGDNFRNYHSVVLSTLQAFRGLCLQACYHLINPNCRWLIAILNWFFVLYPKIAAIMKKIFLAFLTHPMLIANFFPFGFFPVELNSGLTAISNRIHCIPVRLSIFRWLHVTYIHMEGLGYHKGHHWSSTEVAPTLNDLPLEWVWNNTFFNGKTCWPLHRWSMTPVGLGFKPRVTSLSTPNGRPVRAWRLWRASGKPCKRRALATWEAGSWRTKSGEFSSDFSGRSETT